MSSWTDSTPWSGSGEMMFTGMYDEPAGTIARTIPRRLVTSAALGAFSTASLTAATLIPLPAGMVVRNISLCFGNISYNGITHWWFGVADAQLNVLGCTADQLGGAASGYVTIPMTVPTPIPQTGPYYIIGSVTTTTTQPNACGSALAINQLLSPPPVLCGTAGTQILPPAVGSQLNGGVVSTNASQNVAYWLS